MSQEVGTYSTLRWSVNQAANPTAVGALSAQVDGIHPLIAQIVLQRGIDHRDALRHFFNPGLEILKDVQDMKGLYPAAQRIAKAIADRAPILVYGDYDVDGTCATAMMFHFLKSQGAEVLGYNPDRYREGYGISKAGIDYAIQHGIALLLTLDCGIAAVERIEEAKLAGIDVVVCDHHMPGAELPPAFAVLNPKQADCPLFGEELCGCGVAFMLLRKICLISYVGDAVWHRYLPYVAVATCCDIVDIKGLNRSLVKAGLDLLREAPPAGFLALLQVAGHSGVPDVSDVVFKIGPRINAAGRLAHAREAVQLLIQPKLEGALPLARRLEELNRERKQLDKDTTAMAIELMREEDPDLRMNTTVVKHPDWHKGVIGIVASRLTEVCYRPTVVFAEGKDGMLTGSARSVEGFDLYAAVKACAHLLEQFGGHFSAAGLTLHPDKYMDFKEAFEEAVGSSIKGSNKVPLLHIDLECAFSDWFNERFSSFYNQLNRLRPFGPANLEPLFLSRNCRAAEVRTVGVDHLRFRVYQDDLAQLFEVIAFGKGHLYEALRAGARFDMVYAIGSNEWNGQKSFQLEAKDLLPEQE